MSVLLLVCLPKPLFMCLIPLTSCIYDTEHRHTQVGKLYIGNLAFKTTEDNLREAFAGHGEITFARVISDRDSGRSRYVQPET